MNTGGRVHWRLLYYVVKKLVRCLFFRSKGFEYNFTFHIKNDIKNDTVSDARKWHPVTAGLEGATTTKNNQLHYRHN